MRTRTIVGAVVAAIAVVAVATYTFAPNVAFDRLRNLLRRYGRLTRKVQNIDGQPWPYLEGGPADGVPVVLIHGFGADKDNWSLYARELTDGFRVIAPDLPGFGENSRQTGADYGSATQAKRLMAFLDALGIETCHLGGNSMGGLIALRCALDFPERIRTLTLINSAGVVGANDSVLQRAIEAGKNLLAPESADDVTRLMALVVHKPPRIPRRFREVMYNEFAEHRELLDAVFWQVADEAVGHPLNDRLPEVSAPTLVVWGRHDQLIDVSSVDVLVEKIPDVEKVIFEDVGHAPMIENPKRTAAVHRPFLARHL